MASEMDWTLHGGMRREGKGGEGGGEGKVRREAKGWICRRLVSRKVRQDWGSVPDRRCAACGAGRVG